MTSPTHTLALLWQRYVAADSDSRPSLRAALVERLAMPASPDGVQVGDYVLTEQGAPMRVTAIVEYATFTSVQGEAVSRGGNGIGDHIWYRKPEMKEG